MKNFLYLRVNAVIGIIVSLALFFLSLIAYLNRSAKTLSLPLVVLCLLLLFIVPAFHNILIIHIYRRHYPAKEIARHSRIFNTIFSIVCLLNILFFAAFFFVLRTVEVKKEDLTRIHITVALIIVLIVTILIQVTGSFRLIKKVKAGARLQLENSFV